MVQRYTNERGARIFAGGYLGVLAIAAVTSLGGLLAGKDSVVLWPVILVVPLGWPLFWLIDKSQQAVWDSWFSMDHRWLVPLVIWALFVACGALQAWLFWRVTRGKRLTPRT
ncbi:hypothetical protein [Microtetraspora glauca]|uniref:Uncharacterized protein n=1 Tax=Microtetraspora glauca TaxID=1996 RepID=A0ABV3GSK1_MICGL